MTPVCCAPAPAAPSVFNECQTAAIVQSLTVQSGLAGCRSSTPAGPPLLLTIQPGSSAQVYEMFFEPTTLGTHTRAASDLGRHGRYALALDGAAVSTGTETDVGSPPKADILFIIDVDDDPQEETDIINSVPTFMTAAANIDLPHRGDDGNDYAAQATAEFGRLGCRPDLLTKAR